MDNNWGFAPVPPLHRGSPVFGSDGPGLKMASREDMAEIQICGEALN